MNSRNSSAGIKPPPHWFRAAVISMAMALVGTVNAQNVNVSGAVTGNGSYGTLGEAITAIGIAQGGANIVIDIVGNTTEGAASISIGAGTWASMLIRPQGGAARTITAATTAGSPMIDFNGADNVTVDGLNSGGNSLTISNTTVSATSGTSTIRFQGDATNNTITRSSLLGSSTMTTTTNGGTMWFGAGAVTTGNDNNTISFNNIGPAGANLPTKAIYANGSTTSVALYNSGNQILNNNIHDYFNAAAASHGIYMAGGNTAWTYSTNRFYQTATRTQTTGAIHAAIQVANATGNDGHSYLNNIIGYASAAGTGTYTLVQPAASSAAKFYGILISSAGTTAATSIQGNTITAINISGGSSGTTTTAAFGAILVSSGGVYNIGDVTPNIIGSSTTAGEISFTSNSTLASDVYGILFWPSQIMRSVTTSLEGSSPQTRPRVSSISMVFAHSLDPPARTR